VLCHSLELQKNIEEKQEAQLDTPSEEIKALEERLRTKDEQFEHLQQVHENEKQLLVQET